MIVLVLLRLHVQICGAGQKNVQFISQRPPPRRHLNNGYYCHNGALASETLLCHVWIYYFLDAPEWPSSSGPTFANARLCIMACSGLSRPKLSRGG
eukprot:7816152-Pyramimonas_sp.AAC.1